MDSSEISIVPMQHHFLDKVVEIHSASFPTFFLTFLGPRFLYLLYSEILRMPESVALVAMENGEPAGFVAGVTHQSHFYSQLIRNHLFSFACASLLAAARRPSIVPRLFRALSYSQNSQEASAQALLMSIAVAPYASGKGIGQQLVKAFLGEMEAKGISSVSLTTDRDNNERTNHFYRQLGFEVARTYITPEGRQMNEYLIRFG